MFFQYKSHVETDARDMPCKLFKNLNLIKENGIIYARMKKINLKGLNYEHIFNSYFSDCFTIM